MIKYSVMLSGLLGLQNVKNIFISSPVFCTKFVIILFFLMPQKLNILTTRNTLKGKICDQNVNKRATSPA